MAENVSHLSAVPALLSPEEILAQSPTNYAGALEAHAESLEEGAEKLREEAIRMMARATRFRQLAERARQDGHDGRIGADLSRPSVFERAVREALKDVDTMPATDLADHLGMSRAELKQRCEPLINGGKLGYVGGRGYPGGGFYAWMLVTEDDAPNVAPRSSPAPSSAPGGVVPLSERGKPQRIRTERKVRRSMSTPGARSHAKQRDRAYEREQAAVAARAEKQRAKAAAGPKSSRGKTNSAAAEARRQEEKAKAEERKMRSSSYAGAAKSGSKKK
jgi:hypothetical protein